MKTIEFGEDQLNNLQQLAERLFNDEQDPRSTAYIRQLNRPRIHWLKVGLCVVLPLLLSATLAVGLIHGGLSTAVAIWISVAALAIYGALSLKRALICLIKIYQRYAPVSLRNKCRFEPSCSEYMVLSLEKYGLCRGLKKGFGRLKRCNIHDGGFDFP